MQKLQQLTVGLFLFVMLTSLANPIKTEPREVYLFAYTINEHTSRNGLLLAWSIDKVNWHTIGDNFGFLFSDYGAWGSEKRLVSPFLNYVDGKWHCVWAVNEKDNVFAHAASEDLIHWKRQSYPVFPTVSNIAKPQIIMEGNQYQIQFTSTYKGEDKDYTISTSDFKTYGTPKRMNTNPNHRVTAIINNEEREGTLHKVNWSLVQDLKDYTSLKAYQQQLYNETTNGDAVRFKNVSKDTALITVYGERHKNISDMLMGIFFEDINYAADGGIYAELIQNRDFEYHPSDLKYSNKEWNSLYSWRTSGKGINYTIDSIQPIHKNNKHYITLKIEDKNASLQNTGFDGIYLKDNIYTFSVFAKYLNKKNKLVVSLKDSNGEVYGKTTIAVNTKDWKKYNVKIKVKNTEKEVFLDVQFLEKGTLALDMISLFPTHTFKNRPNGLRQDIAQTLADINPTFIRFPGGCVAHGDGLNNIYQWKNTIGPLESRVTQRNIWGYHQTAGLGYYEYFQFCEDVGAAPIPIIASGVPCQNSSTGGAGQQCGIPMEDMENYIEDILDLIEWANGSKQTEWGRKRAEAGHPEPFNLKYIGIGNEDLITDVFEERFTMIYKALQEKHPEITVIGTAGPFYEGTDYDEGWDIVRNLKVPMVDEHYYVSPGWFIHNQDFYDAYDRNGAQVYLGEYASHLPGRPVNIETALSEALYLTALERNGDIVKMASYAPLLAKEKHTQWNPDLIYFNNKDIQPTVGYYVQKMYGNNAGNRYYNHQLQLQSKNKDLQRRVAVSTVKDKQTGDIIIKIINLSSVNIEANLDLQNFSLSDKATLTVLKGNPSDKKAVPVKSSIAIQNTMSYTIPAYSFSLIRTQTLP